jgi:hypothetical protein
VKKGKHSVAIARQYTGTAGRIENAQVGVFTRYASRHGAALIDRRLYLPESWAKDEQRLDPVGGAMARFLRQHPARLALGIRQKPVQERRRSLAQFTPPQNSAHPRLQCSKCASPVD